ncbi:MAG: hypothetical protein EOO59_13680 [Hymenobacter sp.]|nr:MAG: hypothetical protein EOO59_13680 [Hymenobacter sp.]
MSLSGLRWFMLLEAVGQLGLWAWLLRRAPALAIEAPPAPHPAAPALVGLGLLLATARLAPTVLSLPEIAVLQALLLLVLLAEGRTLLVTLGRGVPRLVGMPLAVLLGGTLLLATAQAPAPQQEAPTSPTVTLTAGYLSNYHDADENIRNGHDVCAGSQRLNLYQRVQAGGAEAVVENGTVQTGGGLWVGQQQVGIHYPAYNAPFTIAPDTTLRYTLFDFHLFQERSFGRDWLTLRARLGLHLGDLGHYSYFGDGETGDGTLLMPEAMLRLGHPQLLFAQADAGYGAENALGAYTTRVALGSGLGQDNGSQLLVGYANSAHYPTPNLAFASANLRLPARTGLGAVSVEPYLATDFNRHNVFSLKLHYRLGAK